MKRILHLALALFGFTLHAETVSLSAAQCIQIRDAITALDAGYLKIVPQGSESAKVVTQPFDFSGEVRIALAVNLAAAKAVADTWELTRQKTITDGLATLQAVDNSAWSYDKEGKLVITKASEAAAFNAANNAIQTKLAREITEAMNRPRSVEVRLLEWSDFKLEHNAVPESALAALSLLVKPAKP
jgi:hypothetical protein